MEPSRFDELTKALATATSRRQALKTIAAATIGSILGLRGIGTAFGKNNTCAKFCAAVFGENTPADEQCSADAAHGRGLCYTCGPASPGGTQPICCPQNPDGTCTSYSSATCCPSGQVCQNGSCVTPCTANGGTCSGNGDCCSGTCCQGTCCGSGQICLSNGTCATPCSSAANCPPAPCGCFAAGTPEICIISNETGQSCSSTTDCPRGQFCDTVDGLCHPLC